MNEDQVTNTDITHLPKEIVDRLKKPFIRFFHIEAAGGAVLLLFTVAALALSNSPWAHVYEHVWETPVGLQFGSLEFVRSLRDWINDGLMTLFFFLAALELKRELILGELNNPRMAALSIAAALGGMLVPAGLYLLLQSGQPGQPGWGTVMATDTAFVLGCLALLGSRIPQSLRVFMLSLAIVDDIGAILVVAIGYSSHIVWGRARRGCDWYRDRARHGGAWLPRFSTLRSGRLCHLACCGCIRYPRNHYRCHTRLDDACTQIG